MIRKGFIKKIGSPREWESRDKQRMLSYPLVLSIPFTTQDGKEMEDEVVCEHTATNPEYVKQLEDAMNLRRRCEFQLSFKAKEWQGRTFQDCKLHHVTQCMQ